MPQIGREANAKADNGFIWSNMSRENLWLRSKISSSLPPQKNNPKLKKLISETNQKGNRFSVGALSGWPKCMKQIISLWSTISRALRWFPAHCVDFPRTVHDFPITAHYFPSPALISRTMRSEFIAFSRFALFFVNASRIMMSLLCFDGIWWI